MGSKVGLVCILITSLRTSNYKKWFWISHTGNINLVDVNLGSCRECLFILLNFLIIAVFSFDYHLSKFCATIVSFEFILFPR